MSPASSSMDVMDRIDRRVAALRALLDAADAWTHDESRGADPLRAAAFAYAEAWGWTPPVEAARVGTVRP